MMTMVMPTDRSIEVPTRVPPRRGRRTTLEWKRTRRRGRLETRVTWLADDDFDDLGETAEDEARRDELEDEGVVVGADGWEFRERAVGEGDDGAGADEGEGSSRLKKTRESTVKPNRRFSLEPTDRSSVRSSHI